MTDKQMTARLRGVVKLMRDKFYCLLVEIDQDISAQNQIENIFAWRRALDEVVMFKNDFFFKVPFNSKPVFRFTLTEIQAGGVILVRNFSFSSR
jgi:hypothetical protein